ncbi:MAG: glutamine synthetase type III, partial [Bacteroidota bacterium]
NAMTVLNTIMADTLKKFKRDVDGLIEKGEKKEIAIMHTIREYIVASEKILFEGDGYSDEWEKEAERRGLANVKTTPLALDAMVTEKAKELFHSNHVYSHVELEARHEIELEKYIKKVQIESRLMAELTTSHILPAAIRYQNLLIDNIRGLKDVGLADTACAQRTAMLNKISKHINGASQLADEMIEARKTANKIGDTRATAIAYCDDVKEKYFDDLRYHVDKLEQLVDDKEWYLPKYRELVFLR